MAIYSIIRDAKRKIVDRVNLVLLREFENSRVRQNSTRCIVGERSVIYASSRIDNVPSTKGRITIGSDTQVLSNLQVFAHGGSIAIGDFCYLGEGSRLWSMSSITVGHRVLISHDVNIHDHNAHSLSAADRHEHLRTIIAAGHPTQLSNVACSPVVIEDDAWIGFGAVILKGVRIGRGAIVGAASVVTKDVAPYSIVVGNPAVVVGTATT